VPEPAPDPVSPDPRPALEAEAEAEAEAEVEVEVEASAEAAAAVSPEDEPAPDAVAPVAPTALADAAAETEAVSEAELVSEAGPVSEAEPVSDAGSEVWPALEVGPVPAPERVRMSRRRRTTLLVAVAAVLGVLAGVGTGFGIQYDREPTPLPPLAETMPVQPKGAGPDVPALPASQDRAAVFDGNLLDLLVPIPKGGEDSERIWVSLSEYADGFDEPAGAFQEFVDNEFRRSVRADWSTSNGTYVEVQMTQFRDEDVSYSSGLFGSWMSSIDSIDNKEIYGDFATIPGTTYGFTWPSSGPLVEDGYEPEYDGRGLAQVGNILIELWVDSPDPVTNSAVQTVMNEQLERL